jgi:hypothetical protein
VYDEIAQHGLKIFVEGVVMNDVNSNDLASESTLKHLRELRFGLLNLHKVLLDAERDAYEQVHGSVTSGQLLQLVISHEQFAWLHAISEFIVRIDEMLHADEPATESDATAIFAQARELLKPSETGNQFQQNYHKALQREPAAILSHRDVMKIL